MSDNEQISKGQEPPTKSEDDIEKQEPPKKTLKLHVMDELLVHNLQILENLKEGEKLFLGEDKKLYVDDRWAQPIRRRVDGSSRYDVLFPFFNCYLQSLVRYNELTDDEMELLENSLKGLEILKTTYDDFGELNLFYIDINNTLTNIKNIRVNKVDFGVNCEIIKGRRNRNKRWGEDV